MTETARLVIAIDVGGTKALAGLIDSNLEVLRTTRAATHGLSEEQLITLLAAQVEELRAAAPAPVAAVGLGIPGLVDREGCVQQAPNLPLSAGLPLGARLAERCGLPVTSENDANCAAIAEHAAGAGQGVDDLVLLTVGTGVGGGVVVDGEPLRGAHGMAAELGHLVVRAEGRRCIGNCPNHGCLEAEASGTALLRIAGELAAEAPESPLGRAHAAGTLDGPAITALAQEGDPLAVRALTQIGEMLGVGMSSLGNTFDPALILVGGGVSAAGELLVGPARAVFAARVMPPIAARCQVAVAQFGPEAGLLGAAVVAHRVAEGRPGRAAVARP